MEIKKEIEIGGAKYNYISPDDFIFEQAKIGKKLARKIMPMLQKAGALENKKVSENDKDGNPIEVEKVEIDTDKLIPLLTAIDEMESDFDETDIIALCYVKDNYGKFNKTVYDNLKKLLSESKASFVAELRGCIADFFTYFMPRITEGILTSMGEMKPVESAMNTENIVEPTES